MDSTKPIGGSSQEPNSAPDSMSATNNSASTPQSKAPSAEPWAWPSHASTASANSGPGPSFPQFSASTAEILKRLQAKPGNASGSAAFEAKKAEILQNYVTSDKLPTPPPLANTGRRGRGAGRIGTPSTLKGEVGGSTTMSPVVATPPSARGSGRGRGRGRGRGGGRGGKRKRSESADSDDDSDISSTYTPLPTRTKSGRSVNKPVAFVPTLPEPSPGVKRRRSTKTMLSAKCKTCQRETDPNNNRIVFCDSCNTAYHQYCHNPPISNEVVNVLEKEWLCAPCERSKQNVIEGTDGLVSAEALSIEEKRAYFATLPQVRLVSLLLHATIRHPELPVFPSNVRSLIPDTISSKPVPPNRSSAPQRQSSNPAPLLSHSITSPANGSIDGTPHSQPNATDSSEMDSAEAQLLGETVSHSHFQAPTIDNNALDQSNPIQEEYDDGYDTDPPSHYPKAGQGLARTLRPESEDLQWLVDDNFEVFSHGWKGDGTGMGADGSLDMGGASTSVA